MRLDARVLKATFSKLAKAISPGRQRAKIPMRVRRRKLFELLEGRALLTFSFTGGTYSQDFNTLATSGSTNAWTSDSTLDGWYLFTLPASTLTPVTTYRAGTGLTRRVLCTVSGRHRAANARLVA